MSIRELLRENIKNLAPYVSARDKFFGNKKILLDANESPIDTNINRYPDPLQRELKYEIAKRNELNINQVFLGNGSDETLDLIIRAFCEPGKDEIIILPPTYGMYKVLADINNVKSIEIPLDEQFNLNVDLILESVSDFTKIIFICSPNNPVGNSVSDQRVLEILDRFNGIVVIDEAYIDFSKKDSWIKRLDEFPRLFVNQTFSKSYSAAGIRLGMGFGSPDFIQVLNTIKPPYNINSLTQNEALLVYKDQRTLELNIQTILEQKNKLVTALNELNLVCNIFPSDTNFLMVKVINADLVYSKLLEKGIVVRNRSQELNCSNCLRISVGSDKENQKLIEALKTIKLT